MKHEALRRETWEANLELPRLGLVDFTWGNVSVLDPDSGLVAIKPSGVPYDSLQIEDIVIVDLSGKQVDGKLKPSSDLATHLELYRSFKGIRSVVHTHSSWATAWAQACRGIPALGTTHADYFRGTIPCTRPMTPAVDTGCHCCTQPASRAEVQESSRALISKTISRTRAKTSRLPSRPQRGCRNNSSSQRRQP